MDNKQWSTPTSGLKNAPQPIPLTFSIPTSYVKTVQGGPILLDPYTVQFNLSPPLIIPDNCSAHLIQSSFSYSQPNVSGIANLPSIPLGNNAISMNFGVGFFAPFIVQLATGLYAYQDIQFALNQFVRTHDQTGATNLSSPIITGAIDLFNLVGVESTQTIIFSMNPAAFNAMTPEFPYEIIISFNVTSSIGPLLGFNETDTLTAPNGGTIPVSITGENPANFANNTSYILYISLCKDSYFNNSTGSLLYSFPLGNYAPNSVVSFQPTLRFPVPVYSGNFSNVIVYTTDQNGFRLPLVYYQAPFEFSFLISKNKKDGSI